MRLDYFVTLLVLAIGHVAADTPANCSYADIEGKWLVMETVRGFDNTITGCDNPSQQDISRNRTIELRFPDTAEDNFGNRGHWTLIYNQGFEIVITGRKYFMFSKYDTSINKSNCHETDAGWSHTVGGMAWSCAKGYKMPSNYEELSDQQPSVLYKDNVMRFYHNIAADKGRHYQHNPEYINALNRVQSSWQATHYEGYDRMTLNDMFKMAGGSKSKIAGIPHPLKTTVLSAEKIKKLQALPKEFDWRKMGDVSYVSPVRNQGSCGSCYAFSSMGMNEARWRVATNNSQTPVFSTQDIVECCQYSQGCEGGFPYLVGGKYTADFGIVPEQCNPYTGKDGTCSTQKDCLRSYGYNYRYVGGFYGACNEDEMKIALMDGPMSVSFEVLPDFFHYKGGVYHHVEGLEDKYNPFELTNHAVLLVGFGVDPEAGPFWTVKNSWGSSWGEEGYFRIRRGTDEVSIESLAVESFPAL